MFIFHPKAAASLFLASLTLLATSTPLPVGAADTSVELRQLTHKNFNTSVAQDTWYVSDGEAPSSEGCGGNGTRSSPDTLVYLYAMHTTASSRPRCFPAVVWRAR